MAGLPWEVSGGVGEGLDAGLDTGAGLETAKGGGAVRGNDPAVGGEGAGGGGWPGWAGWENGGAPGGGVKGACMGWVTVRGSSTWGCMVRGPGGGCSGGGMYP